MCCYSTAVGDRCKDKRGGSRVSSSIWGRTGEGHGRQWCIYKRRVESRMPAKELMFDVATRGRLGLLPRMHRKSEWRTEKTVGECLRRYLKTLKRDKSA